MRSQGVFAGAASISALAVMLLLTAPCQASITISTGATQFMNCSAGVCAPTQNDAILNAADLEKLLESGATAVTTTGSGGVQAGDIFVSAALTWTSTNVLTLDANRTLVIEQPVSVDGVAGLNLVYNTGGKGGPLEFRNKGHVGFSSLSSTLTINGATYGLVNSVKSLASAIAANPAGNYALAASYNAKNDGRYRAWPVSTVFSGSFDGLGNTISDVHVDSRFNGITGLFAEIEQAGSVANLNLTDTSVWGPYDVGAFVDDNLGTITRCRISGGYLVSRSGGNEGGFAVSNSGTIFQSQSSTSINSNPSGRSYGGLVAYNYGVIEQSFSTGSVNTLGSYGGGLVGFNTGSIIDSYGTGAVGNNAEVGGLVGANEATIKTSYSTGTVGAGQYVGGFIGYNSGENSDDYWDTTTSGTDTGVGYGPNSGVAGLTTQQLQSGLPAGFSRQIWAEDPKINNGLPYLIANPPQ